MPDVCSSQEKIKNKKIIDVKDVKSSCEKDNCKSTKLVPNSKNNEKNNVDFKSLPANENTSADIMNPFSGNIFEFQKLFAAQMLMLENHKRLLQLPEENTNGHKNSQTSLKEEPLEKEQPLEKNSPKILEKEKPLVNKSGTLIQCQPCSTWNWSILATI